MTEREEHILWLMPEGFEPITFIDDLEMMYGINRVGDIFSIRKMKILKQSNHRLGYRQVYLTYFHGGGKWYKVHTLVARHFLKAIEGKNEVNHINGIKHDNSVENLEWCTHSENILHSYRFLGRIHDGTHRKKKVKCSNGKTYNSAVEASVDTGCKTSNISSCCNGKIEKTCGLKFWHI